MSGQRPKSTKVEVELAWLRMLLKECKFANDRVVELNKTHKDLAYEHDLDSAGFSLENAITYIEDKIRAVEKL